MLTTLRRVLLAGASLLVLATLADGQPPAKPAASGPTFEQLYGGYRPDFVDKQRLSKNEPLKLSLQPWFFNMAQVEHDYRVDAFVKKADELFAAKDYRGAMKLYHEVVSSFPNDLWRIQPDGKPLYKQVRRGLTKPEAWLPGPLRGNHFLVHYSDEQKRDLLIVEAATGQVTQQLDVKGFGQWNQYGQVSYAVQGSSIVFEDISDLRLAPLPFGAGWEDAQLAFALRADTNLAAQYALDVRFETPQGKERPKENKPELPPLSERAAQQVRQLLPIFKDLLEGFELKLRLEVYDAKKWATTTRGHATSSHLNPLSTPGGRLTIFHLTDKHLNASDDGLMLIVPWRQVGREPDLEKGPNWTGLQLLPHVHFFRDYGGVMNFTWRAVQTPHGREYY